MFCLFGSLDRYTNFIKHLLNYLFVMAVNITYRVVGSVVCLYPEGSLKGAASAPIKILIKKLLAEDSRNFIINFKNVQVMDSPAATAMNSIHKEVKRSDGHLILTDAGFDVLPWLEKYATEVPILNDEKVAIERLAGKLENYKGNIAVTGASNIASALFKGAKNYKGLVFHFFDDPETTAEKVIELKPMAIVLNMEHGQSAVQAIRKWRFAQATKECPIILFGPPSVRADAPVLIKEGANDFIEVKFSQAEALAYLKPLDFRNVLARKLDMVLAGDYEDIIRKS